MAECDAGVPGAEKSGEGEGDGLVNGVRSDELRDEKSTTSPFSRTMSGRRLRLMNLTGVEDVLLSKKPAASFCALLMSLASCVRDLFSFSSMADSTGFRLTRFLSPSTVMMGSKDGFEPAREQGVWLFYKAQRILILELDFMDMATFAAGSRQISTGKREEKAPFQHMKANLVGREKGACRVIPCEINQ